jgi:UDP-glucuronate 4-epimerase
MDLLVTGGAGFIGSHLCESLLEKGHSVICIDNFNDYYDPKIKEKNIENCLKNKNFILFRKDITNIGEIKKIFENRKIEQVLHLAARVGVRESISKPILFEEVNVKGTLNLLNLCKEFNIKKFIFISSSSVYGENKKIPYSESDPTNNIISPYAATKRSAEILCETYSRLFGMNITCLRLFTVYGPRGRPEMAPYKFTKLIDEEKELPMFGDGSSKRDYTYVRDIVDGIISAVNKSLRFEIINLGNSKPVELRKFISIIEKTVGKKAKIKKLPHQKGDVSITFADISKAKELLNYSPKVDLEQGMRNFFEWYLKS